jgi:hypothetical protein
VRTTSFWKRHRNYFITAQSVSTGCCDKNLEQYLTHESELVRKEAKKRLKVLEEQNGSTTT